MVIPPLKAAMPQKDGNLIFIIVDMEISLTERPIVNFYAAVSS